MLRKGDGVGVGPGPLRPFSSNSVSQNGEALDVLSSYQLYLCSSFFAAQNSQGWVDVLGNAHGVKLIQSLQRSFGHIFAQKYHEKHSRTNKC